MELTKLRTATAGDGRSYCCVAPITPPDSGVRRKPVVLIGLPPPAPSRPRNPAAAAACSDSSAESAACATMSGGKLPADTWHCIEALERGAMPLMAWRAVT